MAPGLQSTGSTLVVHGLSCSVECGILRGQGSNPSLLHWQADSLPLSHQGSLTLGLLCNIQDYKYLLLCLSSPLDQVPRSLGHFLPSISPKSSVIPMEQNEFEHFSVIQHS